MYAPARAETHRTAVAGSLAALYLLWGSTFLAIRFALAGFPPLTLAGLRYLCASALMLVVLRWRGHRLPTRAEWRSALIVGALLCSANALVVVAEQWVTSSMAAVAIASVTLWTALFSGLFGKWPAGRDWLGLAVGFCGVVWLNAGSDLRASPAGALALVGSSIAWALGSAWSRQLPQAPGLMSSASQMLMGGLVMLALALAGGERMTAVPPKAALAAAGYLVLFGSVVGYSAYNYLLRTVRPAVATSYAYVNPLVAVGLGALVLGERVTLSMLGALALILSGIAVVMTHKPR